MWGDLATVLQTWNAERGAVASLLCHSTTDTAQAIPQSILDESFEEATEFGVPESLRVLPRYLLLGFDLKDYDRATRFTWKALRSMTLEQVNAATNGVLAADNKLVNGLVMRRLFDNTPTVNEWNHPVLPLYNGDDYVPPPWAGQEFEAGHDHYLVSGNTGLDSGNVEAAYDTVIEHGYAENLESSLLVFAHPNEAKVIATWRSGETNANDQVALYDFIPSATAPPYLLPEGQVIQGTPPAGTLNGLKVTGSYGPGLVIPSFYIPSGYLAVTASNGANSSLNPIGLRSHQRLEYQGLRRIAGPVPRIR